MRIKKINIVLMLTCCEIAILAVWFLSRVQDQAVFFQINNSTLWTALAAIGSILLAGVAVYQNRIIRIQANENSERATKENNRLMELNIQANDINSRLTALQESTYLPIFKIEPLLVRTEMVRAKMRVADDNLGDEHIVLDMSRADYTNNCYCVEFELENVSQYPIVEICISMIGCTPSSILRGQVIPSVRKGLFLEKQAKGRIRACFPTQFMQGSSSLWVGAYEYDELAISLTCTNFLKYSTSSEVKFSQLRVRSGSNGEKLECNFKLIAYQPSLLKEATPNA